MNVARTAADVLAEHTTLELECIDRMYLNVYVPMLQSGAGAAYFFRKIRGNPVPSSALMGPMTRRFVAAIERHAAAEGVDLVRFERFERKDDRTKAYLRDFAGTEGLLYIGKAQEKARVVRTERRDDPVRGPYPWLASSTAMVNHYYVYLVDEDFGPLFVKFCSYFPYNAKLCINGHEYLKRQLAKEGIAFEALDNGVLSCADPARMRRIAAGLDAAKIDALLRKWLARLPHPFTAADREAGIRYDVSVLLTGVRPHPGPRPARPGTGLLRAGHAREPRSGPSRPRAVDLRQTRHQAHALAVPNPRDNRRGDPVAARRLQALAHQKQARRGRRDHKEGRALRTETVVNDTLSAGQATTIRCRQTAEEPR